MTTVVRSPAQARTASAAGPVAALAVAGLWFAWQVAIGLSMPQYGDEVTKIIAAEMILRGGRLYDDIFHHHSPLIFAFVQPIAALFGSASLTPYRLAAAGFVLLAAAGVAWSPLLKGWRTRCLTAALFLVMAGALYNGVSLFRLIYQPVAGAFAATFIALYALPLLSGCRPERWQAAAAGLAAGLAIGTNTGTAAPLAAILVLALLAAALGRRPGSAGAPMAAPTTAPTAGPWRLGAFAAGFAVAIGAAALWIALYADFRGLWVFNVHFNTAIYARFVDYHPLNPLYAVIYFVMSPRPELFMFVFGSLAVAGLAFLVLRLRDRACGPPLAALVLSALLGVALIYLNMRGNMSWHTATLAVVTAAFFALVAGSLAGGPVAVALAILGVVGSVGYYATAIATPVGGAIAGRVPTFVDPLAEARARPFFRRIRSLAPPSAPIYVMPFWPRIYLVAERRPASGHFFYLPWQAAYERAPVGGYSIDLCADLRRELPPVIVIPTGRFAGRNVRDYAPCVLDLVHRRYRPDPDWPILFVRDDLATKRD